MPALPETINRLASELSSCRYRAFISYSHTDEAWAKWLHHALETYAVPKQLVGRKTAEGEVPGRLKPVFRDRDELAAAAELGSALQEALRNSAALVVLCSPNAAKSRWVNEEVLYYKRLGRAARVFPLIVGGAPGDTSGQECFPPAVRAIIHHDGTLQEDALEPLAANALPDKDGKTLALLKVIAGITGLPLDELRQREQQRRQKRLAVLAMIGLTLTAVMTVLAVVAFQQRLAAEESEQRARASEYMALKSQQKAVQESRRAAASERVAKAALDDLRRTAPVFFSQSKIDFEEGRFDDAIEKVGYAIQLDDTNADYHLFRANLRESSQSLAAAAEEYHRVLALRPADVAAKQNLALCENLLKETDGEPPGYPQQFKLLEALRQQKRLLEAAPLAALIDPSVKTARAVLLSRLREARLQPRWTDSRVVALPDATFKIGLYNIPPIDFSVLKGQPVSALDLKDTGITDLSSLAGLPLKELNLMHTKAADLSPLHGMPLESLILIEVPVSDLSPLRGMPLHGLGLNRTLVTDLGPLAGMPLTFLDCHECRKLADISPLHLAPLMDLRLNSTAITNLVPLAGAPLKHLEISSTKVADITPLSQCISLEELSMEGLPLADLSPLAALRLTYLNCGSTKITSIAPLRGQPLRLLSLEKTGVTDLSPLAGCTALEEIILPAKARDLSPLRKLPHLQRISFRASNGHPVQTAEEFWTEYDAKPKSAAK